MENKRTGKGKKNKKPHNLQKIIMLIKRSLKEKGRQATNLSLQKIIIYNKKKKIAKNHKKKDAKKSEQKL